MYTTITILVVLFVVLGTFDGLYFHLFKYKLHLLPAARREHIIHTARAFVFVPLALLLFVYNTAGILLWTAIAFVILDAYLELIDIMEERKSRASFGGISGEESAIHVFASSFKFAAILLIFSTKSTADYFYLTPFFATTPLPDSLSLIGTFFAVGSFLGGIYSLFPDFKMSVCCKLSPGEGPISVSDKV